MLMCRCHIHCTHESVQLFAVVYFHILLIIINVFDACQPTALVTDSGYCSHTRPHLPQQANRAIMTLTHFLTSCNASLNAHRLTHDKDNDDDNKGFSVFQYLWRITAKKKKRIFHYVEENSMSLSVLVRVQRLLCTLLRRNNEWVDVFLLRHILLN